MSKLFKNSVLAILLALGLIIASCNESGEPSLANVKLEMKAVSNLSQLNVSGRVLNSEFEFQEVLLGVMEIEFETFESDDEDDDSSDDRISDGDDHNNNDDGDDDHDEIEFEGQFVVDLINGISTPDFGIADVIPGLYEEIEIETGPILEDGNSIFIAFDYEPEGGDPVSIEFSSKATIEIEIECDQGIKLEEGQLNQILVLFDLDSLFTGVDFTVANVDIDDVVRINNTSNSDLADMIWANLDKAFNAGEDKDDDDDIDDDDNSDDD